MPIKFSNNENICIFYLLIVGKYLIGDNFWDTHFILTNLMLFLVASINIFSKESRDIILFICHTIFISLCVSIASDIYSGIYGKIFYFGFVNSIIILYIFLAFLSSELLYIIFQKSRIFICNFKIGKYLYDFVEYIYYTIILSFFTQRKILQLFKYLFSEYIWPIIKFLFGMLISIHNELGNNKKSKMFTAKINEKYSNSKDYITDEYLKYTFRNTFNVFNSPIEYNKNNNLIEDINMNFLANKEINKTNNIDDLDDNDEDLENIPQVSKEQLEQADMIEKQILEDNKKILNNDKNLNNNKMAYKKKMAEKKAKRLAGRNQNMMNSMADIMNMPGMNQLFGEMMKDNNLQKILKDMPRDKLNGL